MKNFIILLLAKCYLGD